MILRPKRLATALAAGQLSERAKFYYLLLWALVGGLVGHVGTWSGWSRLRVIYVATGLLISAVGLLACFGANARGDNRVFLERYVCLSAPLSIATYALYYALYYGMAALGIAVGWVRRDLTNWDVNTMGLISSMSSLAIFFVWMRVLMLRAAGVRAA